MYDFSKKSDTQKYLSEILKKVKTAKIIGVLANLWIFKRDGVFTYEQDGPVYIKFDNGRCLIVNYLCIDELKIEYREMTEEEIEYYSHAPFEDCFNRVTNVYKDGESHEIEYVQRSTLEYGRLTGIELKPVIGKYLAWVNNRLIELESTAETFGLMTFCMDNGKKFFIEPEDAEMDGYSDLWSTDAIQSETKVLSS